MPSGDDTLVRHRRVGERNIVTHRAIEQNVLLQHHADLAAQPCRINDVEVNAVDQNPAAFGDRAVASARRA